MFHVKPKFKSYTQFHVKPIAVTFLKYLSPRPSINQNNADKRLSNMAYLKPIQA